MPLLTKMVLKRGGGDEACGPWRSFGGGARLDILKDRGQQHSHGEKKPSNPSKPALVATCCTLGMCSTTRQEQNELPVRLAIYMHVSESLVVCRGSTAGAPFPIARTIRERNERRASLFCVSIRRSGVSPLP